MSVELSAAFADFPAGGAVTGSEKLGGLDGTTLKTWVMSQIATYVTALIVNSAPSTLDTLEEIADALGDDPNFAATMTTALAGKQPLDAELTALAALVSAADRMPYFTGSGAAALAVLTNFGRTLAALTDAAAARTAIGLYDPWSIKQHADRSLTNSTAIQKIFDNTGSSNGRLTIPAGEYRWKALVMVTGMDAAAASNLKIDLVGAGSATMADSVFNSTGSDTATITNAATRTGVVVVGNASSSSIIAGVAAAGLVVELFGTFTISTGGTIIPSLGLVVASAATLKAGSVFECQQVAAQGTYSAGPWD